MNLSNEELKVILSQLPIIEIDTCGDSEILTRSESYKCGEYEVEFQVRVRTTRYSPSKEMEGILWSHSHHVDFWNISIYHGDEYFIPLNDQEELFEEMVKPKLTIL